MAAQVDFAAAGRDVVAYEKFLIDRWGFYAPMEAHLQRVPGWEDAGYHWSDRAKARWLREDLLALGVTEARLHALPESDDFPRPGTLPEAFGCAYVLENATLEGAQILIALKRGAIPAAAQNFLRGYGSDGAGQWREFCRILDAVAADDDARLVLEENARRASESLGAWLRTRALPDR